MKVVEIRHVEDCFDGSYIREILLDAPTDCAFIHHLGTCGRLRYYADFARPFFTVIDESRFKMKGVEGECAFTVVIFSGTSIDIMSWLTEFIATRTSRSSPS